LIFFTANNNQIFSGISNIEEKKKLNDTDSPSATVTDVSAKDELVATDTPDGNRENVTPKEDVSSKAGNEKFQETDVAIKPEIECEFVLESDDDDKSELSERTRRDKKITMEIFDHNVMINKSKRQIKMKLAALSAKRRCKFKLLIFCFILELNTQFLVIKFNRQL
jgi:hypothetical protein